MAPADGIIAPPPPPGAPAAVPGELTPLLDNPSSSTSSTSNTAASSNPPTAVANTAPTPADISSPSPAKPAQTKSTTPGAPPSLQTHRLRKADTTFTWGTPAGLHIRGDTDESLIIFRRAVGINSDLGPSKSNASRSALAEQGQHPPTGIYKSVIDLQRTKSWSHFFVAALIYAAHLGQIVIGAVLTALGPMAGEHATTITVLGALNTVIAGVLALLKGQGLPERLRKDEYEMRALQDWIEETEALLAVGVVGRDRMEVGALVEVAFRKYNAAKASEENNKPDSYVRQEAEAGLVVENGNGNGNGNGKTWLGRRRSD